MMTKFSINTKIKNFNNYLCHKLKNIIRRDLKLLNTTYINIYYIQSNIKIFKLNVSYLCIPLIYSHHSTIYDEVHSIPSMARWTSSVSLLKATKYSYRKYQPTE